MSADPLHDFRLYTSECDHEIEAEEIDAVLMALAELTRRTTSPIVRACLEEARDDIVHLTCHEDRLTADSETPATASLESRSLRQSV